MKNAITRTIVHATAYGLVVGDIDPKTMTAKVEKVGGVLFTSTHPTQQEAYQALKSVGFKVAKKDVRFETETEEVRAISFEDFMAYSVPVERNANGTVKEVETEDEDED